MSDVVYHVSDTMRLPWIIESGALCPHLIVDIGIGFTNFLWATTKRAGIGDKTSRGAFLTRVQEAAWQEDLFRLVRFTLPAKSFLNWNETVRDAGWTAAQVAELVADDRARLGEDGHDQWHCRSTPLPLADVLKTEVKTYAGHWRPIELNPDRVVRTGDPNHMGYRLGRRKTLFGVRELDVTRCIPHYVYRPPHLSSDEYAEVAYAARRKAEAEAEDNGRWVYTADGGMDWKRYDEDDEEADLLDEIQDE